MSDTYTLPPVTVRLKARDFTDATSLACNIEGDGSRTDWARLHSLASTLVGLMGEDRTYRLEWAITTERNN